LPEEYQKPARPEQPAPGQINKKHEAMMGAARMEESRHKSAVCFSKRREESNRKLT